jgi:hypothetical protein
VLNQPLKYIDPTGHQGEDPAQKRLKEQFCQKYPQQCLPQGETVNGGNNDALIVDQKSVEVQIGPGGTVMTKVSEIGQKIRSGVEKAADKATGC